MAYKRSTFPEQIDSFNELYELPPSQYTNANRYKELRAKDGKTTSEQTEMNTLENTLKNYFISAETWNKFIDVCVGLETFFKNDVDGYITTKQLEFNATLNKFSDKDTYNPTTTYMQWNTVKYNGETYMCKVDNCVGKEPSTQTTYWNKIAQKGDKGDTGVGVSYKGSYNSSATYLLGDAITYTDGFLYYAKQTVTSIAPPNTTYWQKFGNNTTLSSVEPSSKIINDIWLKITSTGIVEINQYDGSSWVAYGIKNADTVKGIDVVEKINNINSKIDDNTLTTLTTNTSITTLPNVKSGFAEIGVEGNTLVNCVNNGVNYSNWNGLVYKDSNGIKLNPVVSNNKYFTTTTNYLLKTSTTYTLILNVTLKTSLSPLRIDESNGQCVVSTSISISPVLGINKIKFTTVSDLTNKSLIITSYDDSTVTDDTNCVIIKDIMILEGDWTNRETPSYFTGIKSVGVTNLFDKSIVTKGYYISYTDGVLQANINTFTSDYIYAKPLTTYKFSESGDICFYTSSKVFISGISTNGNYFTTPSNCAYIKVDGQLTNLYHDILTEGTSLPNTYIPYGTYLPVKSVGKNLFDVNKENVLLYGNVANAKKPYVDGNKYTVYNDLSWAHGYGIISDVKQTTSYNLFFEIDSYNNGAKVTHLFICDLETKIPLYNRVLSENDKYHHASFDTLGDKIFIELAHNNAGTYINSSSITFKNIQLEEGVSPTTYEPYKEFTQLVPLKEPLRSTPSVKDTYVNDVLTRSCGEIVFDGSSDEGWSSAMLNGTNTLRFGVTISENAAKIFSTGLSNLFKNSTDGEEYSSDTESFSINYSSQLFVRINKSKLSTQDVTGFKAWLQANPVTVVYELATPITEIVEPISIETYDTNTTVIIDSVVTPNKTIKYAVNIGEQATSITHKVGDISDKLSGNPLTTEKSNIIEMINETFTYANNGKSSIATAITNKGVTASPTDTFTVLADKVGQIPKGQGNAVESQVLSGATFSNSDGVLRTGTLALTGNATVNDVANGKTFYNTDAKSIQTGTGVNAKRWASGTASNLSGNTWTLSITGLAFAPSLVMATVTSGGGLAPGFASCICKTQKGVYCQYVPGAIQPIQQDGTFTTSGFTMVVWANTSSVYNDGVVSWIAYE